MPLSPHIFLALESLPDGVSEVVERHQDNSQHIYFRSKLEVQKNIIFCYYEQNYKNVCPVSQSNNKKHNGRKLYYAQNISVQTSLTLNLGGN